MGRWTDTGLRLRNGVIGDHRRSKPHLSVVEHRWKSPAGYELRVAPCLAVGISQSGLDRGGHFRAIA
jgi:hypothetical protein